MPRFFFHLEAGGSRLVDEDGVDRPDLRTAVSDALRQARDLLGHEVRDEGVLDLTRSIVIADEDGHVHHLLQLADAVIIRPSR